jgi:hypothetical protein
MDIVICEETVLYFHCNIKVQELMTRPAKTVTFKFIDPTDALVRLLLLSPLAANEDNLSFVPRDGLYYADFHDGARMRRIHEELPAGAVALTSVLFFDEIELDKKGFITGDGVVLTGGFFNKKARESLFAKYSLGTIPTIDVSGRNGEKTIYIRFLRQLRARCHAAIRDCYIRFNNAGGAVLKLQSGRIVYFPRAVILSVYADFPAGNDDVKRNIYIRALQKSMTYLHLPFIYTLLMPMTCSMYMYISNDVLLSSSVMYIVNVRKQMVLFMCK